MYEPVRHIWKDESIPEEWKEAIIFPIHKRGERDNCENYRGIALGNAAFKILSNIILGKMKPSIEKVLGDYQNGFRNGRSVINNIFTWSRVLLQKLTGSASSQENPRIFETRWFITVLTRFPHQNPVHPSPLPHTRHMPSPSHSFRFYHPQNIR